MAAGDRERWDSKHAALPHGPGESAGPRPADPFVLAALERLAGPRTAAEPGREAPRALDLACGAGRQALELARRGWRTEGWDVSPVALGRLAEAAAAEGLAITTRALDLEQPLPAGGFDLVVIVNYLERTLGPRYRELVRAGGHLVLSTFTVARPGERPSARFCLERGELARGFPGFEGQAWQEGFGRAGWLGQRT